MSMQIDTSDFTQLSKAIARLPEDIKVKAAARAMGRVRDMARSRIVKRSAERVDVTQARIRALTTAQFNAGGRTVDIVVRSGWISLYKLGATQTKTGVRVKLRGSFRSAFIAQMKSGHKGVFKREGADRIPIRELFGPNPAHDITNNPEEFLQVLAEVIESHLAPRYLHEVERLLPQ